MGGRRATARPSVLHLTTRLLRGGVGGELATIVDGLGDEYEFTVGFGAQFDGVQVDRLRSLGADIREFPLIRHYNPFTALPAAVSVARYLSKAEFDVVQTHSTEAGIIGRWGAALAGVPHVVHTVHGVPFTDDRNVVLRAFVRACETATAPLTDVFVSKADGITQDYLARGIGSAEQYTTIYSGIDVERFGSAEGAALPGRGVRILMAARLVEGKGFDVLLDAVARLDRDDFSVCVAGSGPLEGALARQVSRRGLSGRVHLLGFREDMPSVYAASDVLVLPSFREGLPRVVSEALAAGLPVVATRVAGIPEQVEDGVNGYLVEPGDADALARRLTDLIRDDSLRGQMARASMRRAPAFSDARMLSELDDLYGSLLEA